ncbi:MAG TPA: IS1595 family transposase, partial [Rhizomicrobium sp.]|nr:IS1595 family transposase [Rhizomicrobium sp.]
MGIKRCKLGKKQQLRLLECFVLGVTARSAADLLGMQANTTMLFYRKVRQLIAGELAKTFPERGAFEVDESYFGGARKGKRGRGAAGKVPVFGILKRGGKVYTKMIADASSKTLLKALKSKVLPDSVVYTDSFNSYDVLDVSEFRHRRVNHSKTFVSRRGHHINGIENFWNQAKRTLRRYNGIPRKTFYLFLKECEFRFNYG